LNLLERELAFTGQEEKKKWPLMTNQKERRTHTPFYHVGIGKRILLFRVSAFQKRF